MKVIRKLSLQFFTCLIELANTHADSLMVMAEAVYQPNREPWFPGVHLAVPSVVSARAAATASTKSVGLRVPLGYLALAPGGRAGPLINLSPVKP